MYGRTVGSRNLLEGITVSVSNTALTTLGQALPPGVTCGTLKDLSEELTMDFIHPVACPPDTKGRYVQLMKSKRLLRIAEVETYIQTEGKLCQIWNFAKLHDLSFQQMFPFCQQVQKKALSGWVLWILTIAQPSVRRLQNVCSSDTSRPRRLLVSWHRASSKASLEILT